MALPINQVAVNQGEVQFNAEALQLIADVNQRYQNVIDNVAPIAGIGLRAVATGCVQRTAETALPLITVAACPQAAPMLQPVAAVCPGFTAQALRPVTDAAADSCVNRTADAAREILPRVIDKCPGAMDRLLPG